MGWQTSTLATPFPQTTSGYAASVTSDDMTMCSGTLSRHVLAGRECLSKPDAKKRGVWRLSPHQHPLPLACSNAGTPDPTAAWHDKTDHSAL